MAVLVTFEQIIWVFSYDPEVGVLIWKNRTGPNSKLGQPAGNLDNTGYLHIGIHGRIYQAHRLVWLWMYGEFPNGDLDHIDRNKTNNKIQNLRVVSRSESCKNRNKFKNNSSGYTGVTWNERLKKWRVGVSKNGIRVEVGLFLELEKAVEAYKKASLELFPEINGGL